MVVVGGRFGVLRGCFLGMVGFYFRPHGRLLFGGGERESSSARTCGCFVEASREDHGWLFAAGYAVHARCWDERPWHHARRDPFA